jgi:N-acetylmuramoyl-L-alanine amidase
MKTLQLKPFGILLLLIFLNSHALGQENFIRLIVPSEDTTTSWQNRQRINGSTLPGSTLSLNDSILKVYPSGAFAAFPACKPGLNPFVFKSVHPTRGTSIKTVWFNYKQAIPEKTTGEFAIEWVNFLPNQDQWLVNGDNLSVRVKAQPGNTVRVLGQNLLELPENLTGGIKGIYQGQYKISAQDKFEPRKIEAEMLDASGNKTSAFSTVLVSVNGSECNRYARSTGKMPALYMGLGTDRLGGAKFGHIDTAILLKVTGRTGDVYRLQLASGTLAWIGKNHLTLLPEGYFPPSPMLTGSFSVTGNEKFDFVRIGLPERLPYTSNTELNPNRIELDIYGATANTNWITQHKSAREIKNIYYRQIAPDVFRVIIELKHPQLWGYAVYFENRALVVKIKRQPEKLKLSHLTIALDAGHGGRDNGALGSTGLKEKEVNLAIVLKLKQALEKKGAKVILTRSDDSEKNNLDKWLALIPQNPDILLSIHNNSIGNSNPLLVKGASTYYKHIAFRSISVIMYEEMLKCGLDEFGNIGAFNFTLNSPTEFINTLLEVAFMSNPEDEMKLMDSKFQDKLIVHIVKGLENFLKEVQMKRRN